MDPFTHGVLGSSVAQAIFFRQNKRNAWLVGGLAAMAPDLDVLIHSSSDPTLLFLYHRYFTHALSFIPAGALMVTLLLMMFKRFRSDWGLTLLAALTGYATHGFLDACTNYGTVLLWPFSNTRISWDIISIIDPFFTIPLVLGLVWSIVWDERRGVVVGLTIAFSFLLFNAWQHQRALVAAQALSSQQGLTTSHLRVFPKLASSDTWRGVTLTNERFLALNVVTPFVSEAKASLIANYQLSLPAALPKDIKTSPGLLQEYGIFRWFGDGYLILANTNPLIVADGRFLFDDNSSIALWGLRFLPHETHAQLINFILLGH